MEQRISQHDVFVAIIINALVTVTVFFSDISCPYLIRPKDAFVHVTSRFQFCGKSDVDRFIYIAIMFEYCIVFTHVTKEHAQLDASKKQ